MTPLFMAAMTLTAFAQEKIVNGFEATPEQFPETVFVSSGNGNCTGSLIHPEWVLTAAHCFDSTDFAVTGQDGNVSVFFGSGGSLGWIDEVPSALAVVHPRYVALPGDSLNAWSFVGQTAPDDNLYELMTNDIALIKLARPVNIAVMGLNITPITNDWLLSDLTITSVGFGITASNGGGGGVKRFADVPLFDFTNAPPEGNWGVSYFDPVEGRGICQGDSGGPAVIRDGDNAYFQIGVTSYGRICGVNPATQMRVDPYIDWILGRADGANDDGVVEESEYIREEAARVPNIVVGATGPPRFECSHQLNDTEQSFAIGVVPFELRCTGTLPDFETLESVTWYWGDGSDPQVVSVTDNPEQIITSEHMYTEMGVYNVRACFEGTRGETPYTQCVVKASHVNACDLPTVAFEVEPLDDLRLGLRNLTSLAAHNCITNAQWQVYEGNSADGEPLQEISGWEPVPQLEKPGTYTLVLNVGGLAGTSAASATVDLKRRGSSGCDGASVAPAAALGMFALVPLLGLRRRD